jgi:hypothetical protein
VALIYEWFNFTPLYMLLLVKAICAF